MLSMPQNDTTNQRDILLTSEQAARSLAISPRKLWSLTAAGEIPHVRIGRAVRYSAESLQEWCRQREEGRK